MQNKSDRPAYAIESVDNALHILLMFQEKEVVRVTDCSNALGVARSTAHRLLVTLTNRGFVQQDRDSKGYRAGPALMNFSFGSANVRDIRESARPVMEELSGKLDETVNLFALETSGVRIIESVEGYRSVRVSATTGVLLPSHSTAGGKMLLAAKNVDPSQYSASRKLSKLTPQTITNVSELRAELDEIRFQGYATNIEQSLEGLSAIAVPVNRPSGEVIAALAISAPLARVDLAGLRRYLEPLRDASAKITKSMGMPSTAPQYRIDAVPR